MGPHTQLDVLEGEADHGGARKVRLREVADLRRGAGNEHPSREGQRANGVGRASAGNMGIGSSVARDAHWHAQPKSFHQPRTLGVMMNVMSLL